MSSLGWRLRGVADLLLQTQCALCQRSTTDAFCQDCQRQIQRCQFTKTEGMQHDQLPVFAWGRYSGTLRRAIAAFKYENKPYLARSLAHLLARDWLSFTTSPVGNSVVVVPIPMHSSKQQQRGFNQAALLAEHFCAYTQCSLHAHGLVRSRETTAQFQLTAVDREQNLINAFQVGDRWLKRHPTSPVLLLDDIYTTGATAHAAASSLRRHGIRVQGIVVLARAEQEKKGEGKG